MSWRLSRKYALIGRGYTSNMRFVHRRANSIGVGGALPRRFASPTPRAYRWGRKKTVSSGYEIRASRPEFVVDSTRQNLRL